MRFILYVSIVASLLACQTKKEADKNQTQRDTTTNIQNSNKLNEVLTFGFSDESGDKILAFEEGLKPEKLTKVIDNQGNISAIKFELSQKGNEGGINLVSTNFSNCAGQVFSVSENKKVHNDQSNVIFNDTFIENRSLVGVKTLKEATKMNEATKNKIATERKRKIKEAWKIADTGEKSAYIVIFEPKQDSVLASLVIEDKFYIYRDYPAKFDAGSTWRVDDGGEFPNDAIKILVVFRNQTGELEIITEWAGAEGANIEYAKANKNNFETIKEASRYWGAL